MIVALLLALAGCSGEDDAPPPNDGVLRWDCPPGWVAYGAGGCGPAALLCADGGGAAPGACDGVTPAPIGAWREPGAPGGPPAVDWEPELPADCAPGWIPRERGLCDPAPDPGCDPGAAALPDGSCTATAERDCPAGEWPDLGSEPMAGARIVHVRAGAVDPLADGSELLPFATIAEGITAAGPGGWVRIAAGEYTGAVDLAAAVHLRGVCAARVRWTEAGAAPLVRVRGAGVELDLRGVTITPGGNGVVAEAGARARIERVRVEGALGRGVHAFAASVEVRDVVVTGTRVDPEERGRAFQANDGGSLLIERSVAIDNTHKGLFALGAGTMVTVRDSAIRRTAHFAPTGLDGQGVFAQDASAVTLERVVLEENAAEGIFAGLNEATVTATDAVIRRTLVPPTPPSTGYGALAQNDGRVVLDRVVVEDNDGPGLVAQAGGRIDGVRLDLARNRTAGALSGTAGWVGLSETRVRETRLDVAGRIGRGLTAQDGGTLEGRRVLVDACHEIGVAAPGAAVTLTDAIVRGTRPRSDGARGRGVEVSFGGSAMLERVLVAGMPDVAINAGHAETSVVLRDVAVLGDPDGPSGRGLDVEDGARLDGERVLIRAAADIAVFAGEGGAVVDLRDAAIFDTRSVHELVGGEPGREVFGRAVEVHEATDLTLTRVLIDGASEMGVAVVRSVEATTLLTLEDVVIRRVAPTDRGFGFGLGTFGGGRIDGRRVTIDGVTGAGVLSVPRPDLDPPLGGGELVLVDVFVRSTASGRVRVSAGGDPEGAVVAYGLHTTPASAMSIGRVVIDGGGYGFYSAGGTLSLVQAVIAGQTDALGALGPDAPDPELIDIGATRNARDEVIRAGDLPEASALAPPSDVCISDC